MYGKCTFTIVRKITKGWGSQQQGGTVGCLKYQQGPSFEGEENSAGLEVRESGSLLFEYKIYSSTLVKKQYALDVYCRQPNNKSPPSESPSARP